MTYIPGAWNADCAACGRQHKNFELRLDWKGLRKCARCWEPRHPQDFVRALPDRPAAPWVSDQGTNPSIAVCTPNGTSAVPGHAVPGCAIPGYVHPFFDLSITEI